MLRLRAQNDMLNTLAPGLEVFILHYLQNMGCWWPSSPLNSLKLRHLGYNVLMWLGGLTLNFWPKRKAYAEAKTTMTIV